MHEDYLAQMTATPSTSDRAGLHRPVIALSAIPMAVLWGVLEFIALWRSHPWGQRARR